MFCTRDLGQFYSSIYNKVKTRMVKISLQKTVLQMQKRLVGIKIINTYINYSPFGKTKL